MYCSLLYLNLNSPLNPLLLSIHISITLFHRLLYSNLSEHLSNRTCRISPLIQCDYCSLLYHTECLNPPMNSLPSERWMCPNHIQNFIVGICLRCLRLCVNNDALIIIMVIIINIPTKPPINQQPNQQSNQLRN